MMHYLKEVLETFCISTKVKRVWLTQHYLLPNIRNRSSMSIEGGSVAFLLLVNELEIIYLLPLELFMSKTQQSAGRK